MFRSSNPIYDAERYNDYMEEKLNRRPRCSCCNEPIQEEYAICIEDKLYCGDCEMDDISDLWHKIREEYLVPID